MLRDFGYTTITT